MQRGWAAFILGACAVCCGQTAEIGSQRSGEGDASSSGGTMSSGGATSSGGSVHSGGRFDAGAIHGLGAAGGGGTGGSEAPLPPFPPWVFEPDGGAACPAVPASVEYECMPTSGVLPDGGCYPYFEEVAPQIVGPGRYPVHCRIALPEPAASGCGPRICVCMLTGPSPTDSPRGYWRCPER